MPCGERSPRSAPRPAFTASLAPKRRRGGAEKRNTDLRGSFYISRNTFEALEDRFEPLASDEECIEIDR